MRLSPRPTCVAFALLLLWRSPAHADGLAAPLSPLLPGNWPLVGLLGLAVLGWLVHASVLRRQRLRQSADQALAQQAAARNAEALVAAQDALQASEARLQAVERVAQLGHWEMDVVTWHMHWSDQVYRVYEVQPGSMALTNKTLFALVHPDDRKAAAIHFEKALKGELRFDLGHRVLTPGGRVKHVHSQAEVEFDAQGVPQRIFGTVKDMTEHVETQQALEARSQIFTAIVDQAADSIALIDPEDGRIVEFNRAAHHKLGYSADAFSQLTIADIHVDAPVQRLRQAMDHIMATDGFELEAQHRHKLGELRDVHIHGRGLLIMGKPHLAVIWSDITERKAQAAELERYRKELQQLVGERTAQLEQTASRLQLLNDEQTAIFDSVPVGIVLLQERTIVRGNRQLERLLGYDAGELNGKPTRTLYENDQADQQVMTTAYEAVVRGERHRREQRLVRRDGSGFWARITGQLIDVRHPEQGGLAIIEDIDLEHAAAAALREGTAMAEAAAQVKADFLANMSHEIRTPLNAILGMAHLALGTELNTRQLNYLERIQSSGKHLLGIVNDILDFSKIEAGKLVIERSDCAVASLFANVDNLISEKAAAKGLALAFEIAPEVPPWVLCDPLRLGQVLANFGSNAVKFTERGEVNLSVGLLARDGQRVHLRFSVRDTGIGLSTEQQARLFQPFTQADSSTTRRFGGTGLGLSIARQLVALMEGELGVDSQPGVGSCFWFQLWLDVVAPPASPAHSSGPSPDQPRAMLRGARLLLVEDNDINQQVAYEMLHHAGFEVQTANNGQEALEALRTDGAFDLVFMDMQMPVLDGLQATRAIRAQTQHSALPIIAMTANVMAADRQRCLDAGMNDFIAKPIEPAHLWSVLRRWLPAQPPRALPEAAASHAPPAPGSGVVETTMNWAIDGMDTALGLRRCNSKPAFYQRLVRMFVDRQDDNHAQLTQAVADKDWPSAERMAHTLKGVAGNLGALRLQGQAETLEQALRAAATGSPAAAQDLTASLQALEAHLGQLLPALKSALSSAPLPPQASTAMPAVGADEPRILLQQLRHLLEDGDTAASDWVAQHARDLPRLFGTQHAALVQDIQTFHFDQALARLRGLAQAAPTTMP